MKSVWFAEKRRFWGCLGKFSTKRNVFSFAEKAAFSVYARPLGEEKLLLAKKVGVFNSCKANRQRKAFSKHRKTSTTHRTQTNVQQPFSNIVCYCELAVQHPFFESQQSCVCCIASLSHRFKSSPAIPGKFAVFCVAGYMMNAGHLG